MSAQEARDRLAALLPDVDPGSQIIFDEIGVVLGLTTDQADALADRLAEGDEALAKVAQVEAALDAHEAAQRGRGPGHAPTVMVMTLRRTLDREPS